jgi:hypothetical protein
METLFFLQAGFPGFGSWLRRFARAITNQVG